MNPRLSKLGTLAASTVLAVTLAGTGTASASVTPNTFVGYGYGSGATLAIAESNASSEIDGDYYGCSRPYYLVSDTQLADGSWTAEMAANNCKGYR